MTLDNLTPKDRYRGLMSAIDSQLKGSRYELHLEGIDELRIHHDSPILEACNTSFQVHLQVTPEEFVQMYNISQALAGPVMAIAANSPLVFGRRLWHESRIAMFQQSIDTRSSQKHLRQRAPRVMFGHDWLHESILDIYRDDITRFRVLMCADVDENSEDSIRQQKVPKLKALQVHNSTVYRWNRPCYGISDNGKPHLRIENRVLPSGPTVVDEVANAAFWLGLMMAFKKEFKDIGQRLSFDDVRDNFMKAATNGIDTTFNWFGDSKISACALAKELVGMAREGLKAQKVDSEDIDRYLDIIEARAEYHRNGARWMLRNYSSLLKKSDQEGALTALTSASVKNQKTGSPVHTWQDTSEADLDDYRPFHLSVEECMSTDVLSVRPDDIIELVGDMMTWKKSRYVLVEDDNSHLVGVITHQQIVKELLSTRQQDDSVTRKVSDIMIKDPVFVPPTMSIKEALKIMKDNLTNCLPVVNEANEIIGVITEAEFLRITRHLIAMSEAQGS